MRQAAQWIARDNPAAAQALRAAAFQAAQMIAEHPDIGQLRSDMAPARFRFLVLRGFPYVVVYEAGVTPPIILRVLHGARDLAGLLSALRG